MAVILNLNVRVLVFNCFNQSSQECRTSNTCHILKTDLICTVLYHLVYHAHIVLNGVDRRVGDTECSLSNHTCLFSVNDRTFEVAVVIQSAERTHNVGSLSLLNLCHKSTYVIRYREHSQCVKTSLKHVSLNSHLVERSRPLSYCLVRILSKQKVNLLKSTTVTFNAVKATHINNYRSNLLKHRDFWNVLSGRLPHIPVKKGEFYFSCHIILK